MKIPFLYFNVQTNKYVVILGSANWVIYDARWAADGELGPSPLMPDLDVKQSSWDFATEKEALGKMKELWEKV